MFKSSPPHFLSDANTPCPTIQEDEIISRSAAIEYMEDVDVPPVGSSLSLGSGENCSVNGGVTSSAEDEFYFFGDGDVDDTDIVNNEPPIFPDMSV